MSTRKHTLPTVNWLRANYSVDNLTGIVTGPNGPVGSQTPDGYLTISLKEPYGFNVRAHRLVFALNENRWPSPNMQIDHINGIRNDNRWSNLREVSPKKNTANRKTRVRTFKPNGWGFETGCGSTTYRDFCKAVKDWQKEIRNRPSMQKQWKNF